MEGKLWGTPRLVPEELKLPPNTSIVPTQEDFMYEDMEALCRSLHTLATDSNKYRAKVDRRRQRSIFRAVLHFVEVCSRTWVSLKNVSPRVRRGGPHL